MSKPFLWEDAKNSRLIGERGISFDEIVFYIMNGCLMDVIPNNNQEKFPRQRVFVVNVEGYIHSCPIR